MTGDAIGALRADREAVLELGAGLSSADWAAASGCPGWSARDVLAHMGALLRLRWITQRGDWQQLGVTACGDEGQLCLAAQLKVF